MITGELKTVFIDYKETIQYIARIIGEKNI